MKILFVTRKFPPSVGGMEQYAYDLYNALDQKAEITLIKWGGSNKALPVVIPYLLFKSLINLRRHSYDFIYIQDGLISPIGHISKKLFKVKFALNINGLDITYNNKLYQKVIPRSVRKADIITCISHATSKEVVNRGVEKEKIFISPLGIEDNLYNRSKDNNLILKQKLNIDQEARVLLSVGRLVKRKGVDWFINNVLPELISKEPNIKFLVAGEGEEHETINQSIHKTHTEDSVLMLGRVNDDFLKLLFNGSDMFIMPNIRIANDMEGFGRVLLEASSCELPIVASDIEGIKDAITNGKNGVLVKEKATHEYISQIIKFSDKKYAKDFGEKSREYTLNKFKWSKIASRLLSKFQEVLDEG